MAGRKLTLAVERYDRTLPLLDGRVKAEGIDLEVIHVPNNALRDTGILKGEPPWDFWESGQCAYFMAKAQNAPITGIPVFTRRMFPHSRMFINTEAGIRSPVDLRGRRIGLFRWQATPGVIAKGLLQNEYGITAQEATWVRCSVELVPFQPDPPAGVKILQAPVQGRQIDKMLVDGEIDALFVPWTPAPVTQGVPQVARLFPDTKAEEKAYYKKYGFWPSTHTVAMKPRVLEESPGAARSVYDAFVKAQEVAMAEYENHDWTYLAWGDMVREEQMRSLGDAAWSHGLNRNRKDIETFVYYQVQQGLIPHSLTVEELFAPETLDT